MLVCVSRLAGKQTPSEQLETKLPLHRRLQEADRLSKRGPQRVEAPHSQFSIPQPETKYVNRQSKRDIHISFSSQSDFTPGSTGNLLKPITNT